MSPCHRHAYAYNTRFVQAANAAGQRLDVVMYGEHLLILQNCPPGRQRHASSPEAMLTWLSHNRGTAAHLACRHAVVPSNQSRALPLACLQATPSHCWLG